VARFEQIGQGHSRIAERFSRLNRYERLSNADRPHLSVVTRKAIASIRLLFQESLKTRDYPSGVSELTLPNNEYFPALGPKPCHIESISLLIPIDLLIPEGDICLRWAARAETAMTMPETAVDEDDLVATGKHEIRSAWKFSIVQAIAVSQSKGQPTNRHFWLGIFRPNLRHDPTACLLVEFVDHNS
jgi:hypothetical protein